MAKPNAQQNLLCRPLMRRQLLRFGNHGTLEQHGFARNKIWVIDNNPPPLHPNDSDGKSYINLLLKPSQEDLKVWPHSFEFRLRVALAADGCLTLISRVDRVYLNPTDVVAVFNHEIKRTVVIRKEGLPDVVVWNPWEKKSKSLVDFRDKEYKHMLCVDRAATEKPITLKPGEEWTGRLELSVVP